MESENKLQVVEMQLEQVHVAYETNLIKSEQHFLETLIESNSLPPFIKTWQQAFTIMEFGKEFGFSKIQSMHQIIMINGVMTLKAGASASLLRRAKVKYRTLHDFDYVYSDGTVSYHFLPDKDKPINRITEIEFERDGIIESVMFTFHDAEKADLLQKDNWIKWRREMAYWRCLAKGARRIAPDVLQGMMFDFEMGSTPSQDEYHEVTVDSEQKF